MFRRQESVNKNKNQDTENQQVESEVQYSKPNILLMDLDDSVAQHLVNLGFNTLSMSLMS